MKPTLGARCPCVFHGDVLVMPCEAHTRQRERQASGLRGMTPEEQAQAFGPGMQAMGQEALAAKMQRDAEGMRNLAAPCCEDCGTPDDVRVSPSPTGPRALCDDCAATRFSRYSERADQ